MTRPARPALVLATNLVVGAAGLAYILHRFGAPAAAVLWRGPRAAPLLGFLVVVATTIVLHAVRWRTVLAGIAVPPALGALTAYRAAGQAVSNVLPSAKLGGEPLRVLLLARAAVPVPSALASVVVDRALEMGAAAPFALVYALLLLRRGVPELEGALVTVSLGVGALALGIAVTARRLRRGRGLVTSVARATGLDRLSVVHGQMDALATAEQAAARLVGQPGRLGRAFALGVAADLLGLVEYGLLLAAFGLPAGPMAVVAAVFATGAAHSLPVPAAIGALEGAQMWLFGLLGHPPEVGLAIGLAVRLRELVWTVPGLVYLAAGGLVPVSARPPALAGRAAVEPARSEHPG